MSTPCFRRRILVAISLFTAAATALDRQLPLYDDLRPTIPVLPSDWKQLNSTLGGRLIKGRPFAEPCFSKEGVDTRDAFASPECIAIRGSYLDEFQRSDHPGGYINTQWETCQRTSQQCLLDTSDTSNMAPVNAPYSCHLGSLPEYFIDVQSDLDISVAFEFSKRTGVPIVIKNTGHDYKGRSSAPGSLALWTHNLKDITHTDSFTPEGCRDSQSSAAVTLGAGVQFQEIYDYAEEHGFTFVGGSDPGVGAVGGWLQGGGHGALSNTMGLGVDRVLQFKVVTPDGKLRTANACQNQDLFFALRGGGGGTFGVVLSATSLISPPVTLQVTLVSFAPPSAPSPSLYTEALWEVILDHSLRWASQGYGAFITAHSALYITPMLTRAEATTSMAPLVQFGKKLESEGVVGVVVRQLEFTSWGKLWNALSDTDAAKRGIPLALASRLIPSSNLLTAHSRKTLLSSLLTAQTLTPGLRLLVSTPFNHAGDGGTSVTDAWRDAVFHVTLVAPWGFNSTMEERERKYSDVTTAAGVLREITPVGAYGNEADIREPDHEYAFWGKHYTRLLEIKAKYDPDHLLDCWQCVGWNPESPRFKCYH